MVDAAGHPGREALDAIAWALKAQPGKDDPALSEAARCLATFRKAMLARRDAGEAIDLERLEHLNAVIAVVMAMHFPIGKPPWDELTAAYAWLREVVAAEGH